MLVNQSVRLPIKQYVGTDANKLREALNVVPPGTPMKMKIHRNQGDRPWESDSYELEITWSEER